MNVYVESNFVLELALSQEQHHSCAAIIAHCTAHDAVLYVPAFCLIEPYWPLHAHEGRRRRLGEELARELTQLGRSTTRAEDVQGRRDIITWLARSSADELRQLNVVINDLRERATVIPLDAETIRAAVTYQLAWGISPQDSLVLASIVGVARRADGTPSIFVTRDTDFRDPDVIAELQGCNCEALFSFPAAVARLQ